MELPDVRHNHHHMLDEFLDAYKNHHLSFGEIKLIFQTADRNHDNKVSFQEWQDFFTLFVEPFQSIDSDGNYLLSQEDLWAAISAEDTLFDGVQVTEEEVPRLVQQFDRFNSGNQLNFADYLFLRKANLAWKECASETGIGYRAMSCALQITSPGRVLSAPDAKEVYELAFVLKEGKNTGSVSQINFLEFIGVAHLYYYFSAFELPFQKGVLTKKSALRAIDDAVLPSTLGPLDIHQMYGKLDQLTFKGFGGLLWAYRTFSRYDNETPGRLSLAEWNEILAEPDFNPNLLALIDGFYLPSQEEIEQAGLKRLGAPASEKDYLINYLETKSKLRKSAHKNRKVPVQEDARFEDSNRDIVYRIFDSSQAGQMKYADFAAFWTYSWLFLAFDVNSSGSVDDQEIAAGERNQVAVVPLDSDQLVSQNDLADWIGGKRVVSLNVKQFYDWFRYRNVFSTLKTVGTQVHAAQWKLADGFVQLGLRLASSTEKLAHDGYDELLGEKSYHYKQAFIWALEDEIIASKVHFGQNLEE